MLEALILRWGYFAVAAGTFIEGEAVLIAAGALAHRGLLSVPLVLAVAATGTIAGDQLWFWIGRRYGRPVIAHRPRWQARVARVEDWLARFGAVFVFGFRFVYGIRLVTPVVLGASAYPALRFLMINILGGVVWSIAFGGLGWALGASLHAVLARTTRAEELLAVAGAASLLLWLAGRAFARRRVRASPSSGS